MSDLEADDMKLWLETHAKECHGIAVGHFEQPDRVAYETLLVPKSGHYGSYKIVVLSKVLDQYSLRLLDHADAENTNSDDSGLIVSKNPMERTPILVTRNQ